MKESGKQMYNEIVKPEPEKILIFIKIMHIIKLSKKIAWLKSVAT